MGDLVEGVDDLFCPADEVACGEVSVFEGFGEVRAACPGVDGFYEPKVAGGCLGELVFFF